MRALSVPLPTNIQSRLAGRDVIVFDGVCVLCSGFFKFITRFDRQRRFGFATAQSPLGQDFYRAMDLPTEEFETNLVVVNGRVYQHLDAFAAAMRALGGVWWVFGLLSYLPAPIKRPLYFVIARNRYRLFGRKDSCILPDPLLRARFLEGGF